MDNARKVLFLDPAKRSEVQQTAMTDVFLGSCGNVYPKDYCDSLKLGELRTKLNELNAKPPPISYAPVLLENDTPPQDVCAHQGRLARAWRRSAARHAGRAAAAAAGSAQRGSRWRAGWCRRRIR